MIRPILRVAVLAALLTAFALAQETPPPTGIEALAKDFPRDFTGVFCLENPGKLLADIAAFVDGVGMPVVTEAWRRAGAQSAGLLGFDATHPDGWRKGGFDLSRPAGLAVRQTSQNPAFLISLGVLDEAAALESLNKVLAPLGVVLEKEPATECTIYRARGAAAQALIALGVRGDRMIVYVCGAAGGEAPAAALKAILTRPGPENIAAEPAFRRLAGELPRDAWFSVYSSADPMQMDPGMQMLLADKSLQPMVKYFRALKGAAYAVGERDSAWILSLDPQAGLLAAFPPGLDCAAGLGRLDRPVFAASLSLDWSGDLPRLAREMLGEDWGLSRLTGGGPALKNSPFALLGQPKGKSALGVAFYLRKGTVESYEYVLVARFEDAASREDILRKATGQADPASTACGDGEYYAPTDANPSLALGQVGDTLFMGPPARVRAALEAREPRWKPRCGGAEPFMAEVWPGDLITAFGDMGSEEASRFVADLYPPGSTMTLVHSLREDSALIRVRTEGGRFMLPGVVAVIAIPALLQSKQEAQCVATMAMLRNLASAEVAFSSKIGNDGRYGTFQEMVDQGFLDSRFAAPETVIDGFAYSMSVGKDIGKDTFKIVARGQGAHAGKLFAVNESLLVYTDEACTKPVEESPRRRGGQHTPTVAMLRNLASAEVAFSSKIGNDGKYGTLAELCAQRFIDTRFKEDKPLIDGFRYAAVVGKDKFKIVAKGEGEFAGQVYAINECLVVHTDEGCTRPLSIERPAGEADRFSGWEPGAEPPDENLFEELAREKGPNPVQMLRNVASAEIAFSSKIGNKGRYGTLTEMAAQGFLDQRFKAARVVIDDYVYTSTVKGAGFRIVARGIGPNKGKLFAVDENLVVCTDEACKQPMVDVERGPMPVDPD
ncbi:MAG: hypothetical protein KA419_04010 [Acidobacteria bacterium]|nr:hypothetical protein [Acidobacteriota bacterium]